MDATINKRFLLSTLAEVGAYNRRGQEEDCWRRRRLEAEAATKAAVVHGRNGTRNVVKDEDKSGGNRHRNNAGKSDIMVCFTSLDEEAVRSFYFIFQNMRS